MVTSTSPRQNLHIIYQSAKSTMVYRQKFWTNWKQSRQTQNYHFQWNLTLSAMVLAKSPGQIGDNITCNLWPGVQWVPIPPTSQPEVVLEPVKNIFAHYLDNLWLFWASCILAFASIFKLFEGRCSVVNNNERLFWGLWEVIMGGGLGVKLWGYNNNTNINNNATTTISFSCLNEHWAAVLGVIEK